MSDSDHPTQVPAIRRRFCREHLTGGAACAVLAFVIYIPSLFNGYIWDDDYHVTKNAALETLGGLLRIWTERGATPQYYPLVHTSFWLEYRLWGLAPAGYHFTNNLLHALNAMLLWRILTMLGLRGAPLAAILFAIHPVHVESVTWITERKNVLSAFFYLLAMISLLNFWERGGRAAYARAFLFLVLALLSKTVTASFSVIALLLEWMRAGRIGKRHLIGIIPFFVIGLALGLNTVHMEKTVVGAVGHAWDFTLAERALLCSRILWFYPAKIAWPSGLAFIYARWPAPLPPGAAVFFGLSAALLIGVLVRVAVKHTIRPLVAALFFAVTLAPATGFFDVFPFVYSFVADHFQYLASLGVTAVIGWIVWESARRVWRAAPALAGLAGCLSAAALVLITLAQQGEYKDERTLWTATTLINPHSTMVWNNLAVFEINHQGDLDAAGEYCRRALEIQPENYNALFNLADIALKRGDAPAAMGYYSRLVSAPDPDVKGLIMVSTIFSSKGRLPESLPFLRRAIEVAPDWGVPHYMLAQTLSQLGQNEEAELHFDRAAKLGFTDEALKEALQKASPRP